MMEQCEKCNGSTEWTEPPGWLLCKECGHKWWFAIVDPALPEPTPEEKAYWNEEVELIFQLGKGQDRLTRIIELRKVSEEFSSKPLSWIKELTEGKTLYSFGKMSRKDASWQISLAERRDCKLEIMELKRTSDSTRI